MRKEIILLIENLLGLDEGTINENTLIEEVNGWDSLMHVIIIGELECKLGISIPLDEAIEITSISEIFEKAGV